MRIHSLRPTGRRRAACLTLLALLGTCGLDMTPAQAWTKNQTARQERYMACKVKLQANPPCNDNWTRQCAKRCHARYI